jgi:curli biogenesis system outer membrane secretion channel CsgG
MRTWLGRMAVAMVAVWAIAGSGTAAAQGAKSTRPTIAVVDFEFGSVQNWWGGQTDIGKGIADLLVDALLEDGSYRIIERKKLGQLIGEQDFSNSDRADPSAATVAKIGKMLGVKYLVVGSITKFGAETKNIGLGGFGSKLGVGNVGTSKGKATVAITARIIDTSTGEIMASAKGEGTSSRSGLMLGGASGGAGGHFNMTSSDFHDTVIGEATEAAVKAAALKLVAAKNRLE